MTGLRQILFVLGLGLFWGAAPALNKMLGLAGVPLTHIMTAAGFGVGLGLLAIQRLSGVTFRATRQQLLYGLGCAALLLVPWAISIVAVRYVPVALVALITSTTPMMTYALALAFGSERFRTLRLAALIIGLASCAVIIISRTQLNNVAVDGWLWLTISLPLLYAAYDYFAAAAWPKGMPPLNAGIIESIAVGLICLPLVLVFDPVDGGGFNFVGVGYALLAAATALWVIERICFFNMIQLFGPVTTGQSVYVSTPASVLLALVLFAEPADLWLGASLVLLMTALWLNNHATKPQTNPEQAPAIR